ncbi:MAG: transglycosylase SLT domain-containing protein, partial [Candidatus Levybacteria bacterium]|nr:transglycosylase SLT domain-containing protein [Candidatus Levybacteria bacterium]
HLARAYQNHVDDQGHSHINAALHRAAGTTPQPIAPSPAQKTPFFQKLTQPLRQPGIRYARQNKNRATPSTVRRPPNAKRPFLPSFPSLPGSLNLLNPLNPKKYLWLLLIIFGAVLAFLVFDEGGTVAEDTGDAGVSIVVTGPPKFTPDTSGEVDIGSSDESGSIGDGTTKNTTPQNTGDGTGIGDGSDATGSVQGIATGPDDINKPKAEVLQANVGSRAGLKPSKYDITVTVTGSADDVVVRLPLDPKGVYIAASQPCTYENGSVVWHLNQRPSATADGLCDHQQPVGDGTSVATSPEQTNTSQPASFPLAKFQGYGFPAPQSPSPQQMTGNTLSRWNTLKPLAQQAASATGVDIGIIGMWPWLEGSFVPFDNCDREHNLAGSVGDADHNTQCPYWGGAWQVGLGLHPAYTHMFVKEAFDTMYNGHDNATVQKVGNNVITNMRNRHGVTLSIISNPFPNVSLDTIITGAVNGDLQMRNLLTTLMKDDAIGIYMIARHFRDNVGVNSGLASKMEGWSSSYYNRQKIVNYIKGVYDAGVTGGSTDGSVSGGTSAVTSGTYTLSILILPKTGVDKEYIYEYATAEMINPRGTGSSGIGDNTQDTSGDVSTGTTAGLTCSMASPTQEPWPNVNKWNDKIIQAIALAKKTEGVEVPGNIVKAIMMMESGGDELPPNMSDYRGLMQVSEKTSKAEGSNCDWHNKPTYDVNTTQGNVNCGVQHLARGIKTCNGDTSAIIGQYFTGQCNYSSSGPDKFGTTPNAYVNKVIGTYNFLNSQVKDTCK